MNSKTTRPRIAAHMALFLLISLPLLLFPVHAYDFAGTVEKVSETNSMTVNVTQAGTYGLQAKVEVLLDKPLAGLTYFKGKELQFEIQGRDILGRPVCEAYLNGINIQEVSNCRLNPVECSYLRNYPAWKWAGYDYSGDYYIQYYAPCNGWQCQPYYPHFLAEN
ncbi:MAG: hypothetical protein M0Q13_03860 [Methanothrix sp.]|nr:hypothetical protein [Methanothrix sp.]